MLLKSYLFLNFIWTQPTSNSAVIARPWLCCGVSPIIAKFYMESFNQNAFRSDSYLLEVWYCYIDDTHVETNKEQNQEFTYHINCQNPHIKFTNDLEKDDQLQFLDTLVKRQTEVCKSVCTPVYRKSPSYWPLSRFCRDWKKNAVWE